MTTRKLFFLRDNEHLPEGTLVELIDAPQLTVPDGGDGTGFSCRRDDLIECPPFAENVPPGQCPVKVTSFFRNGVPADPCELKSEQNIHHQVIEIPFAVESVVVTDRVTGKEADSYYPSGGDSFTLHVGHLRPGFYRAAIDGTQGKAELTFIKFFPPAFAERYRELTSQPPPRQIPPRSISGDQTTERWRLLNKALELATEWGENFRKPIHDRIRYFYPGLSDDEIDELTATVREAELAIYRLATRECDGEISEHDIHPLGREAFPWIDDHNLSRLANIGMYYARK